jgi:hypothetical protein
VNRLNIDPSFINADGQIELLWSEDGFKSASTYTPANHCSGINYVSWFYSKIE